MLSFTNADAAAVSRVPELHAEGITILLFHGVCPTADYGIRNYTGKHIGESAFRFILDQLCRRGSPISMDSACAGLRGESPIRPYSFCVTFDDGFRNNMSIAVPILEDLGVPSTIYVTTDFIEENFPSWIDQIEAAVASSHRDFVAPPPPMTGVYPLRDRAEKVGFLSDVRRIVKAASAIDPLAFARTLTGALIGEYEALEFEPILDDKLTWDQLRSLSGRELVSIGGHGKTHRPLGFLNELVEVEEVNVCTRQLGGRDPSWIRHFSYPEGFPGSFSGRTVGVLSAAGWQSAVTTTPGVNSPGQDLFRLNRYLIA